MGPGTWQTTWLLPSAAATELLLPLTLLIELRLGLAVAAPVGPELPPAPVLAVLLPPRFTVASPVLPAVPVELALELVALPVVALPLLLQSAVPDWARIASPDCELHEPLLVAFPDPAVAVGLAVELPLRAVASISTLEDESPELPPLPESPLVAVGLLVTVPELPSLLTSPALPDWALPPAATELLLPLVPFADVACGPALPVPVPPEFPPLPVLALLFTPELTDAGGVSASATTALVAAANTIPRAARLNAPSTLPACLAGELRGAPKVVSCCSVSMERREPRCPIAFVSIPKNSGT